MLFFALLIGLPLAVAATGSHLLAVFDAFYRSGSLVFGGGHVVLPLLQAATVQPGWVGDDAFLAGYGAAQAVPGPPFTFAAYLGPPWIPAPNGWIGGLFCLIAIFLPAFLLAIGPLPFWNWFRQHPAMRSVLKGVNAAVVGLLLAALYNPVDERDPFLGRLRHRRRRPAAARLRRSRRGSWSSSAPLPRPASPW